MKTAWYLLAIFGIAFSVPLENNPTDSNGPEEFDENFPEENPGLYEGDIEILPGHKDPNNRNAITDHSHLWTGGVLPYVISSGYSSSDQASIRMAMKTIEDKTKVNGKTCIHFTPHTNQRQYIKFVSGTGCHTPVGRGYGSSAVTLGRGCLRIGTIMHEINHALGTWHEQSRHDRDNYVTIDFSNIQSGHEHNFNKHTDIDELGQHYDYESVMHYGAYSFAKDRRKPTIIPKQRGAVIGRSHNFVKYTKIDELGEPYDYDSVMHYGAYAFANDRRKPTIVPKQRGAVIGQRTHLSTIDIKEMQILYGCISRPNGAPEEPKN